MFHKILEFSLSLALKAGVQFFFNFPFSFSLLYSNKFTNFYIILKKYMQYWLKLLVSFFPCNLFLLFYFSRHLIIIIKVNHYSEDFLFPWLIVPIPFDAYLAVNRSFYMGIFNWWLIVFGYLKFLIRSS